MALCEGPITGINQIWKNQSVYTLAEPRPVAVHRHDAAEPVELRRPTAYPSQALALSRARAYVCAENYSLGDTATLDNHNFEVQGLRYGTGYGQLQYNSSDVAGSGTGHWLRRCRSGA